jgi:hypothetical protein
MGRLNRTGVLVQRVEWLVAAAVPVIAIVACVVAWLLD